MNSIRFTLLTSLLVASAAILDHARTAPSAASTAQDARSETTAHARTASDPAFLTEFGEVWTRTADGDNAFVQDSQGAALPRNALADTWLECGKGLSFWTGDRQVAGNGIGPTKLAALNHAKSQVLAALGGLSGVVCEWCEIPGACTMGVTTVDPGWTIVSLSVSDDGATHYATVTYTGSYTVDCTPCE
jgi:hypothetical protein